MQYVKELGLGDELYKVNPMVTPHPLDETYVEEVCRFPITEASQLSPHPLFLIKIIQCVFPSSFTIETSFD